MGTLWPYDDGVVTTPIYSSKPLKWTQPPTSLEPGDLGRGCILCARTPTGSVGPPAPSVPSPARTGVEPESVFAHDRGRGRVAGPIRRGSFRRAGPGWGDYLRAQRWLRPGLSPERTPSADPQKSGVSRPGGVMCESRESPRTLSGTRRGGGKTRRHGVKEVGSGEEGP